MSEYTPTKDNIFFICYLVELLCRETLNDKPTVVLKMTRDYVLNICEYEDIYHCLNPKQLVAEQKQELKLIYGFHNPVGKAMFRVPPVNDMAKLYRRLIYSYDGDVIDNFFKVMTSPICNYIDDYNSSLYYENYLYISACIEKGEIIRYGADS